MRKLDGRIGKSRMMRPAACTLKDSMSSALTPVLPILRIGQRNDLAAIARVGQDFLIPRHRGVEHDLADRAANRADTLAVENRSVGKRKEGGRECTHEKLLDSA